MMKFIKKLWKSLLGKDRKDHTMQKRQYKKSPIVKRVELLKQELHQLTSGYNNSISEIETRYKKVLWDYENAYSDLAEVSKKHKLKIVPESEVIAERKKVLPFEEALQELTEELEKVKGYKREDVLKIATELNTLKDEYISEIAEEVKVKSERLSKLKQEYVQGISSIGSACSGILETESIIEKIFTENGYTYKPNMADKFATLAEGVIVNEFVVSYEHVQKALNNNSVL